MQLICAFVFALMLTAGFLMTRLKLFLVIKMIGITILEQYTV